MQRKKTVKAISAPAFITCSLLILPAFFTCCHFVIFQLYLLCIPYLCLRVTLLLPTFMKLNSREKKGFRET